MLVTFAVCLFVGLVAGSFVEYWGHRGVHIGYGRFLRRVHLNHHREGFPAGAVVEGAAYAVVSLPVTLAVAALALFLGGWVAAAGIVIGGLAWAMWAGYSHQVQHEIPDICFWVPTPLHWLHHFGPRPKANYGLGTHVWDWVYGTYDPTGWAGGRVGRLSEYLSVGWVSKGNGKVWD
jgi:sterol desaturase/sphingolipid hydroxylase (fatty acid hydroxylase superfamily)